METTAAETNAAAETSAAAEKRMKMLVPIDESDGSFYALRWALDHLFGAGLEAAAEQEQAAVTLVNVQPVFQPFIYPAGPGSNISFNLVFYFISWIRNDFLLIYLCFVLLYIVVYATPAVIDSVTKAQEQNAANILARALRICKEHKVFLQLNYSYWNFSALPNSWVS